MKKIFSFILILLIVVLITTAWWYLYQKTQDVDRSEHYKLLSLINDLKRLDTELTSQVILLRLASNNKYDDLSSTIQHLEEKKQQLDEQNIKSIYQLDNIPTLSEQSAIEKENYYLNKMKKYQFLYQKKAALVKQFKLKNGALTNSINFIPIATDEVIEQAKKLRKSKSLKLRVQAKELLLAALKYTQFSNNENLQQLKMQISEMEKTKKKLKKEEINAAIRILLQHANTIIEKKIALDNALKQLPFTTPRPSLDELAESFIKLNEQRLAKVAEYRLELVIFSAVLLLLLAIAGYLIWRSYHKIKRVNQSLEKRVAERTATLSNALERLKESQTHLVQSEKMASLGQMVAGVAHEINTPLGYVKSNIELIQDLFIDIKSYTTTTTGLIQLLTHQDVNESEIEEKIQELAEKSDLFKTDDNITIELEGFIDESLSGLETINELVLSLKNFSRMDTGTLENIDIHDCINSTLLVAKNKLKGVVLIKKQFSKNIPKIKGASSQLNQVLLNLIVNASQAMPERDSMGTVTIRTLVENDYVLIKVLDNGKGMPESVLKKIFDPFYTTKPVGEGTGLGLSISYKIIQEHGGKLLVSSIENKGTQFTIALPVPKIEEEKEIEDESTDDFDVLNDSMFGEEDDI